MKRFLKTVFCVMTICAMVSFVGCGGDDKKDDADGTKAGDTTSADGGSEDKGSDAK